MILTLGALEHWMVVTFYLFLEDLCVHHRSNFALILRCFFSFFSCLTSWRCVYLDSCQSWRHRLDKIWRARLLYKENAGNMDSYNTCLRSFRFYALVIDSFNDLYPTLVYYSNSLFFTTYPTNSCSDRWYLPKIWFDLLYSMNYMSSSPKVYLTICLS